MLYSVFIWTDLTVDGADVYDVIDMPNAEAAVQETMVKHQVSDASYAWAAPADESVSSEEFYNMHCAAACSARQEGR